MNVIFSDIFNNEVSTNFGITKERAQQVLDNPESVSNVEIDDLTLGFFIKRVFTNNEDYYYLLVCTRIQDNSFIVDLSFKILPELITKIKTIEPIVVLQELTQEFGLIIRMGYQLNKFIVRETIPVEQEIESTNVVSIINPKNHSFLQSIYLKIQQHNDTKVINCAIAYCIDTDEYKEWINGKKLEDRVRQNEVLFEIAPQLKGRATLRDFLHSSGTISFISNYSEIGESQEGYLLKIQSENHRFEIGFNSSHFYFIRNSDQLEYPIEPIYKPTGNIHCFAMWEPTNLQLLILDETYKELASRPDSPEAIQEIERRKRILETEPTLPPNSLINWARKVNVLPETTYKSIRDFNETITSLFQSIEDKINTIGLKYPFWNITYEGSKIVSRNPKHETEIHPTIHAMLYDSALVKNLQIIPEYPIAGGKLDFLISGMLTNGEIVSVCIEFKPAHSDDLIYGLVTQLPIYMQAKGSDYGLYCVLYFKGPYFSEPKYSVSKVFQLLHKQSRNHGLDNIRIFIYDLSQIVPPSKLK